MHFVKHYLVRMVDLPEACDKSRHGYHKQCELVAKLPRWLAAEDGKMASLCLCNGLVFGT